MLDASCAALDAALPEAERNALELRLLVLADDPYVTTLESDDPVTAGRLLELFSTAWVFYDAIQ
jgi:hypothetical protein